MLSVKSTVDFTDAAAVQQLVGSSERLVCLRFQDGLRLYSHKYPLALASGVLSNVLEDTQQQFEREQFVVPLVDDNAAAWKTVLGLIHAGHRLKAPKVTLDNAQGLMLLAHKYEMPSITAQVLDYLMGCELKAASSRLVQHLTKAAPAAVIGWLTTASRCALPELVKLCIDYAVGMQLPVSVDVLNGLDKADANLLLSAMQAQHSKLAAQAAKAAKCRQDVASAATSFKSTRLYQFTCSEGHDWVFGQCHRSGWTAANGYPKWSCPWCHTKEVMSGTLLLDLHSLQRDLQSL